MVGIPTATQQWLTPLHHSLPTILYTHCQNPMPSYSKAPRGLSVLLQVAGIFTGITTSPGLQPRQLSNHFTIRAGRNLPDKEFRYLRTVIVTAAVHLPLGALLSFRYVRHPFSRSYGAILQSSLARVILSALSFSLCPPVSVYSTGAGSHR